MQVDKTLKTKELIAMIMLFIGVKLSDTTASLFAHKAQNGYWLIAVVSLLVILPPFFLLLYLLKKYKDKNVLELTEHLLGKFFGKFVVFLLFLFSFCLFVLDSRNYVEEVKLLYFPESPLVSIYFIFLGVSFFGAKRGLETIGTTSWLVFPFIKISMFFLAFLILGQVVLLRVFPIFGSGLDIVLVEGVKKASVFSEFIILTIAYTSFKDTKYFQQGGKLGAIIVSLELILFFFLYTLVFDYNSIAKVTYPFHDITQFVNFGEFFTNVETFFMVFWLSAAFLRFIIYLYLLAMLFGATFNIKEFEPLLLPFAFITVMLGLLTDNSIENELLFRQQLLHMSTPLFVLFPVLLWLTALVRGEFKRL